jgi:hypothetical protein
MRNDDLAFLYQEVWKAASSAERSALAGTANLKHDADPAEIFSTIPRTAARIPAMFSRMLWDELEPEPIRRIELADVRLSEPVSRALQLAFAHELGERIDRAIARLAGTEEEAISQAKLEAAAEAEGLHWQVLSYALSRESEPEANN